jgi:hypothetical protein
MTDSKRVPYGLEKCAVCGHATDFEDGVCHVCGAPETTPAPDQPIEWRIVRTVNTAVEAELMAGRLRALGIPAIVLSQVDTTRNFTVGELAIAKVYVPLPSLEQADTILSTDADVDEDDVFNNE